MVFFFFKGDCCFRFVWLREIMFEVAVFWSLDFLYDTCPLPRLKWEEIEG